MSVTPSAPPDATTTERGLMSAADKTKLDAQSGTNTGDVTVTSPAGWLSRVGQALTFALVSASATVAGVVDFAAQTFAGVKTFTSTLIASAGIQLGALWNTNGTGASDVGVKIGVSTADASVNASAKIASFRTGIGGTEVEYGYWSKGLGLVITKPAVVNEPALVLPAPKSEGGFGVSGAIVWSGSSSYILDSQQSFTVYSYALPLRLRSAFNSVDVFGGLGGAGAIGLKLGTRVDAASFNATARLASFLTGIAGTEVEHAFITKTEVELTAASGGVVLKSPDGTRYRITVANGGTLTVAPA